MISSQSKEPHAPRSLRILAEAIKGNPTKPSVEKDNWFLPVNYMAHVELTKLRNCDTSFQVLTVTS